MRLDDPNDALGKAVTTAAAAGPLTRDRTTTYLGIVLAAAPTEAWAKEELAAIQHHGAAGRFKKFWKPAPVEGSVGGKSSVPVQTIRGVFRDEHWNQLPLGEFTIPEFDALVEDKAGENRRVTGEVLVLRRVQKVIAKHAAALPPTALVADALKAAKVDLLDVITGAA